MRLSTLFPTLLVMKTTFASEPPADISEKIDCENGLTADTLRNFDSVYLCRDSSNILFHSLKLGSTEAYSDLIPEFIEASDNEWIEVEIGDHEVSEEKSGVPYTGCLSLEDGATGSLQATITHTYGLSASLELKFSFLNAVMAKSSHSLGATVGGSTTLTAEYVCPGKPGETVQLQLTRRYHLFRHSRWRKVALEPRLKFTTISRGTWKAISAVKSLIASPMVRCVTNKEMLHCGKII